MKQRCAWPANDELMTAYHDEEWGVPVHDDRMLFEFLMLETAQAGLSWRTILQRREGYRRAFANFEVETVARFTARKIDSLLRDESIIRNRLKVEAAVKNARAFLKVREEFGSFDAYVWPFVGGCPIHNRWTSTLQVPATSPEAEALGKDLKRRGFSFVGPTIVYAYMQATGMVNDHVVSCYRYRQLARKRQAKP